MLEGIAGHATCQDLGTSCEAVSSSTVIRRDAQFLRSTHSADKPIVQTKGRPRWTRLNGSGEGKAPRKRALVTCRSCGKQEQLCHVSAA